MKKNTSFKLFDSEDNEIEKLRDEIIKDEKNGNLSLDASLQVRNYKELTYGPKNNKNLSHAKQEFCSCYNGYQPLGASSIEELKNKVDALALSNADTIKSVSTLADINKNLLYEVLALNKTLSNIHTQLRQFDKQDIGTHQIKTTVL